MKFYNFYPCTNSSIYNPVFAYITTFSWIFIQYFRFWDATYLLSVYSLILWHIYHKYKKVYVMEKLLCFHLLFWRGAMWLFTKWQQLARIESPMCSAFKYCTEFILKFTGLHQYLCKYLSFCVINANYCRTVGFFFLWNHKNSGNTVYLNSPIFKRNELKFRSLKIKLNFNYLHALFKRNVILSHFPETIISVHEYKNSWIKKKNRIAILDKLNVIL